MSNEVFISYRREGGSFLAYTIFKELSERGISAFYDLETMKAGTFDSKLDDKISECSDFVFIVSKGAFDRCHDPEDWVRREIGRAIKCGKNIIPVITESHYKFPTDLPDDIKDIARYNGVLIDDPNFLNAKIDKLVSMLSFTKAGPEKRALNEDEQRRLDKLSFYLDAPKMWVVNFIYHFCCLMILGVAGERNAATLAVIFTAIAAVMLFQNTKLVKRHICKSWFWSVMFVLFVSFFYGFYTFVITVMSAARYRKWAEEQSALKARVR